MLSYQHIYHAGCLADVHKHAALSVILNQMVQKDKSIYYMETHAGRGLYDLSSPQSTKTGEANAGILALEKKLPATHPYKKVLTAIRKNYNKNTYPGSPMIAHEILRRDDRLFLMELHPQEVGALSNVMNFTNSFVHNDDGYKGVLALSPPLVRRGFVMIDPSYEVKEEYNTAAEFIKKLHKKWPETVIMLWYPILKTPLHKEMAKHLQDANLPKYWQQEVIFNSGNTQGSGLIICNLPYGCEADLKQNQTIFR